MGRVCGDGVGVGWGLEHATSCNDGNVLKKFGDVAFFWWNQFPGSLEKRHGYLGHQ